MSARLRRRPAGDVWMDSRKVRPGDVFVALRGEDDDGHTYVEKALAAGAAAAIIARSRLHSFAPSLRPRLIAVDDPLQAVGRMARAYREKLNIPFIAITGSNGKTTTRRIIASVLRARFTVGETVGNWNNNIGVPLTILRFRGDERIGVVEMAANHGGEIRPLSHIASPDIAVITNIGYAHIGNFGSLAKTTDAKFEITSGFRRGMHFCLLNGDDPRLVARAKRNGYDAVLYGFSSRCAVRARDVEVAAAGMTAFSVDGTRFVMPVAGRHFVYNALPAVFLGRWFGMNDETIAAVLRTVEPDPLRGRIAIKRGVRFIVDCYNANPSSMHSAIALLCDIAPRGRRAAIVGDMMELGRYATVLHRQVGRRLGEAEVSRVIAVGRYASEVAAGAAAAGIHAPRIQCAADAGEALAAARSVMKAGDTVLLKASRAVKLESVFERF